MALEEAFIDRHRLDRDDRTIGLQALDPVDQQHRIAMRQRRHHPLDVERTDGRPGGSLVHLRVGAAGAAGAVVATLGSAALRAASTSAVTSSAGAAFSEALASI